MKTKITWQIFGLGILIVFAQTAQGQWRATKGPGNNAIIMSLAISGSNLFAGTSTGLFRSNNNGDTWTTVDSIPTIDTIYSLAMNANTIVAGAGAGGIFLSSDSGNGWTAASKVPANANVTALAMTNSTIFAGTADSGIFTSSNNGATWIAANSGLASKSIMCFAINGSTIFAGTAYGGAFLSTNNAETWTAVDSGLTNRKVWSLAAIGGTIFAGTSGGGVFRSNNNGKNWTAFNSGLPSLEAYPFGVSGDKIIVATGPDMFLSTNNGTAWTDITAGFMSPTLNGGIVANSTYLFAGGTTYVWRRLLQDIAKVDKSKYQAEKQKNPGFSSSMPSTTNHSVAIDFYLPNQSSVSARIYNMSGHAIATLADCNFGSGPHRLNWDTKNTASGCYMIKMQTGLGMFASSIPITR